MRKIRLANPEAKGKYYFSFLLIYVFCPWLSNHLIKPIIKEMITELLIRSWEGHSGGNPSWPRA